MRIRRLLAMLLAAVMVVGMLPANVFATEVSEEVTQEQSVTEEVSEESTSDPTITVGYGAAINLGTEESVSREFTPETDGYYTFYLFVPKEACFFELYACDEWIEPEQNAIGYDNGTAYYYHVYMTAGVQHTLWIRNYYWESQEVILQLNATTYPEQVSAAGIIDRLFVGENFDFAPDVYPMEAYDVFTWVSSAPECLRVSEEPGFRCLLEPIAAGEVTVTGTSALSGNTVSFTVEVVNVPRLTADEYTCYDETIPANSFNCYDICPSGGGTYAIATYGSDLLRAELYCGGIMKPVKEIYDGTHIFRLYNLDEGTTYRLQLHNDTDATMYGIGVQLFSDLRATDIELNFTSVSGMLGDTCQLTAFVTPSYHNEYLTWEVDNDDVLQLQQTEGENCEVIMVGEGTATVTVRAGEVSASCEFTVKKNEVLQDGVTLSYNSMLAGDTDTYYFTPNSTGVHTLMLSDFYLFFTVKDENGYELSRLSNGFDDGYAYYWYNYELEAGKTYTVEVYNGSGDQITYDILAFATQAPDTMVQRYETYIAQRGMIASFDVDTITPDYARDLIQWSVSDESVLQILGADHYSCQVMPLKGGTAEVIATAGDVSASCTVTVNAPTAIEVDGSLDITVPYYGEQEIEFTAPESGYYYIYHNNAELECIVRTTQQNNVNVDDQEFYVHFYAEANECVRIAFENRWSWDNSAKVELRRSELVTDVTVSLENNKIYAGQQAGIKAYFAAPTQWGDCQWSTADESIAKISYTYGDYASVMGVGTGTTAVTVTVNGVSASVEITSVGPTAVTEVDELINLQPYERISYSVTPETDGYYTFVCEGDAGCGFTATSASASDATKWEIENKRYDCCYLTAGETYVYEVYNEYGDAREVRVRICPTPALTSLDVEQTVDCDQDTLTWINVNIQPDTARRELSCYSDNIGVADVLGCDGAGFWLSAYMPGTANITVTDSITGTGATVAVTVNEVQTNPINDGDHLVDQVLSSGKTVRYVFTPAENALYAIQIHPSSLGIEVFDANGEYVNHQDYTTTGEVDGNWFTYELNAGMPYTLNVSNNTDADITYELRLYKVGIELTLGSSILGFIPSNGKQMFTYTAAEAGGYVFTHDRMVSCVSASTGHMNFVYGDLGMIHRVIYLNAGETYSILLYNEWEDMSSEISITKTAEPSQIIADDESESFKFSVGDSFWLGIHFDQSTAWEQATWTISDPNVLKLVETGGYGANFEAIGGGSATVTASISCGSYVEFNVTVKAPVDVTALPYSETVVLEPGEAHYLLYTPAASGWYTLRAEEDYISLDSQWLNAESSANMKWWGEHPSMSMAIYLEAGESYKLMARNDYHEAQQVTLTFDATPAVQEVTLETTTFDGTVGGFYHIMAHMEPVLAYPGLTWTTSDDSVATVEEYDPLHGTIHFVGIGTATITATAESGASASCVVTVSDLPQLSLGENMLFFEQTSHGYYRFVPVESGNYYFRTGAPDVFLSLHVRKDDEFILDSYNNNGTNFTMDEDGGRWHYAYLTAGTEYLVNVVNEWGEPRQIPLVVDKTDLPTQVGDIDVQRLAATDAIPVIISELPLTASLQLSWTSADSNIAVIEQVGPRGVYVKGVNPGETDIILNIDMADGSVENRIIHVIVDGVDATVKLGESVTVTVDPGDVYILGFTPEAGQGNYYFYANIVDGAHSDIVGGSIDSYDYEGFHVNMMHYDAAEGTQHMLRFWYDEGTEPVTVELGLLPEVFATDIYLPEEITVTVGDEFDIPFGVAPLNGCEFVDYSIEIDDESVLYSNGTDGWSGHVMNAVFWASEKGTAVVRITVYLADGTAYTGTCTVTVEGAPELPLGENAITFGEDAWVRSYSFTPEETGFYYLRYEHYVGAWMSLNGSVTECVENVDEAYFYRVYRLQAGTTYDIIVERYEPVDPVVLAIEASPAPEMINLHGEEVQVLTGGIGYVGYDFGDFTSFGGLGWSVEDTNIADVAYCDMERIWVCGIAVGETTVTLNCGEGVTASFKIVVKEPDGYLSVGTTDITLEPGQEVNYIFTVPTDGNYVIYAPCDEDAPLAYSVTSSAYISEALKHGYLVLRSEGSLMQAQNVVIQLVNVGEETMELAVTVANTQEPTAVQFEQASYTAYVGSIVRPEIVLDPVYSAYVWGGFDAGSADENILRVWDIGPDYVWAECVAPGTTTVTYTLTLSDGTVLTATTTVTVEETPVLEKDVPFTMALSEGENFLEFTPATAGLYTFTFNMFEGDVVPLEVDWTSGEDGQTNTRYIITWLDELETYTIIAAAPYEQELTITVSDTPLPTEMTLSRQTLYKQPGIEYRLFAGFAADTFEIVNWSTSNSAVVEITGSGMAHCSLQMVAEGTATVTATTASGLTATCEVTVSLDAPIGPEILRQPEDIYAQVGETVIMDFDCDGAARYKWYVNDGTDAGWQLCYESDVPVFELGEIPSEEVNGWQFKCIAYDSNGYTTETNVITLYVGDQVIAEGTCGDSVYWQLWSNGELIVYGSGPMHDYNPAGGNHAPWHDHRDKIHRAELTTHARSTGITYIGSYAFAGLEHLEELVIPETVTSIGAGALEDSGNAVVCYTGTQEAWAAVEIAEGNETLESAEISYEYGKDPFEYIDENHLKLIMDLDASGEPLDIPAGMTLDLNGHTLKVFSTVSFGNIIDTSEGGTGLLITEEFVAESNGSYLPIFDTGAGGYRFFAYELNSLGTRRDINGDVIFGLAIDFENAAAYDVMAASEDTGIVVMLDLCVGQKGEVFELSPELVIEYAALQAKYPSLQAAMMLTVTGIDTMASGDTLVVTPYVEAPGIAATGSEMTFTKD